MADTQFNFKLNSSNYSWQTTYFELLHDSLLEAFNEIIPVENNSDLDWKDDEAIQRHAQEIGLLDRTLALAKQKFIKREY